MSVNRGELSACRWGNGQAQSGKRGAREARAGERESHTRARARARMFLGRNARRPFIHTAEGRPQPSILSATLCRARASCRKTMFLTIYPLRAAWGCQGFDRMTSILCARHSLSQTFLLTDCDLCWRDRLRASRATRRLEHAMAIMWPVSLSLLVVQVFK